MSDQQTTRPCVTHHYACDCREAAHAAEIDRLRAALEQIASHDTGMREDFSVGARQAKIAREALAHEQV